MQRKPKDRPMGRFDTRNPHHLSATSCVWPNSAPGHPPARGRSPSLQYFTRSVHCFLKMTRHALCPSPPLPSPPIQNAARTASEEKSIPGLPYHAITRYSTADTTSHATEKPAQQCSSASTNHLSRAGSPLPSSFWNWWAWTRRAN